MPPLHDVLDHAERWRRSRALFLRLPPGDAGARPALIALSDAEDKLFQLIGGMDGPPFEPSADSDAGMRCPLCFRAFPTTQQLIQHLRDRHQ